MYQPINTRTSLKSKSSFAFSWITLFSRGVSVSCPPRGKLSSPSSNVVALHFKTRSRRGENKEEEEEEEEEGEGASKS